MAFEKFEKQGRGEEFVSYWGTVLHLTKIINDRIEHRRCNIEIDQDKGLLKVLPAEDGLHRVTVPGYISVAHLPLPHGRYYTTGFKNIYKRRQ